MRSTWMSVYFSVVNERTPACECIFSVTLGSTPWVVVWPGSKMQPIKSLAKNSVGRIKRLAKGLDLLLTATVL